MGWCVGTCWRASVHTHTSDHRNNTKSSQLSIWDKWVNSCVHTWVWHGLHSWARGARAAALGQQWESKTWNPRTSKQGPRACLRQQPGGWCTLQVHGRLSRRLLVNTSTRIRVMQLLPTHCRSLQQAAQTPLSSSSPLCLRALPMSCLLRNSSRRTGFRAPTGLLRSLRAGSKGGTQPSPPKPKRYHAPWECVLCCVPAVKTPCRASAFRPPEAPWLHGAWATRGSMTPKASQPPDAPWQQRSREDGR